MKTERKVSRSSIHTEQELHSSVRSFGRCDSPYRRQCERKGFFETGLYFKAVHYAPLEMEFKFDKGIVDLTANNTLLLIQK